MEALRTLEKPSHIASVYVFSIMQHYPSPVLSPLDEYDSCPVLAGLTSIPQELEIDQQSMHE